MDYVTKTKDAVLEWLEEQDNATLVAVHNIYCQNNNDPDSEIFENGEEFFETSFGGRVMDAVRAVVFGDYEYHHKYVMFNGYANLESFDDPEDQVDYDAIADDILENEIAYLDYVRLEEEEEDDDDETEDEEDNEDND